MLSNFTIVQDDDDLNTQIDEQTKYLSHLNLTKHKRKFFKIRHP